MKGFDLARGLLDRTLAESHITFGSPITVWVLTLILGIGALAMLLLYYRDMRAKSTKRGEVFLWAFRVLVITWLVIVLLEPTIVRTEKFTEESNVVVLIDVSDSMKLKDRIENDELATGIARILDATKPKPEATGETPEPDATPAPAAGTKAVDKVEDVSRKDILKAFLEQGDTTFLQKLAGEFGVRVLTFATDVKGSDVPMNKDELESMLGELGRNAGKTDIGAGLGEVEKLVSKGGVSGIVVFTDGDWNTGSDPLIGIRRIAGANVPVYVVGLGNPDEVKDVEVTAVRAKKSVQINDTISVSIDVKTSGYENSEATLQIVEGGNRGLSEDEGEGLTRTILQEKKIDLRKNLKTQTVVMEFKAEQERMMYCKAVVVAKPDEAKKDNNSRSFEIEVTKAKKKVLYVEQLPRWEWRFIKNAIGRDQDFELTMVLFNADDRPSQGEQYLPTIPLTKRELFTYDVIILGDIARTEISAQQMDLIEEYVSVQGSPLVVISGPFHMPYEFHGTAIDKVLPVVLGGPEGGIPADDGFRMELTAEGWTSPILRLAETRAEDSRIWSDLPPFYWCASVEKAKEGATVLATHPYLSNRYGKMPLVLTQRYGTGKVLMLNIDETWRWRYEKGDLYHYRFWGNVLRWLAASPLDGKTKHVLLSIDKKEYYPGEKASISARVVDKSFFPYTRPKITLRVLREPGTVERISLDLEDKKKGIYTGEYEFTDSGSYEIATVLPELDDEGDARVRVDVKKISVEDNSLRMNQELLEKMSAITGGSFHYITTAASIPDEILDQSQSRVTESRQELWDKWYAIAAVVGFLTLEWVIRKRLGYV